MTEPQLYFYRHEPAKSEGKSKKKRADAQEEEEEAEEPEYTPYPGLKVVLPSAPSRPITAYDGEEYKSWYDYLTDHEGEKEDEFNAAHLAEVTKRVHALL